MTDIQTGISRRAFGGIAIAAIGVLAAPGLALAKEPEVFQKSGVAIRGYDPVAYFTEKKPVKGKASFTAAYKGATWRFASAENRALFVANPAKYAPVYGGYCAYAVANGATAPTDPDAWTVHEGKLYLNYNQRIRRTWSRDIPGNVAKANANWPKVLDE